MSSQRQCPYCQEVKPEADFPSRGNGTLKRRRACGDCYRARRRQFDKAHRQRTNDKRRKRWREDSELRERSHVAVRKYRANNQERIKNRNRERYRQRRVEVINRYGGKCVCCGETMFEFLVLDHVHGGGGRERKTLPTTSLIRKLYTSPVLLPGYRILCHNCNMALGFYGYCPHVKQVDTAAPKLISDFAGGRL